jgi:tripartite-type tricarboxylate transporter receptor subunit TctC
LGETCARKADAQTADDSPCGLAAALTISLAAPAAEYPSHPVTIIVAFTPGGPSDVLARIIGRRLQDILHQPFIIENRPGSGGNIAAEQPRTRRRTATRC